MCLGRKIISQDTTQNDQDGCLGFEHLFAHDKRADRGQDGNVHDENEWLFIYAIQK